MYEISGFFLFEALRNSLGLERFEGRGFNTSGRYEKLEKCWITDERLWITIQPFYGRWKLPIFAKLFIKQFFTSFWFCIKTSQLVHSYKATCFEFDLHKNENDTIANTIFFLYRDFFWHRGINKTIQKRPISVSLNFWSWLHFKAFYLLATWQEFSAFCGSSGVISGWE